MTVAMSRPMRKTNDLEAYVRRLIVTEVFPSQREIAAIIGMNESALTRSLRVGTLTVEQCLRLAIAVGADPGSVLSIAGRGQLGEMVRLAFQGGVVDNKLTPAEREFLQTWRRANAAEQIIIRELTEALIAARAARSTARGRQQKTLVRRLRADDRAQAAVQRLLRRP